MAKGATDCHKENAWPVRSEPQESHAAPWRLQTVANRPEDSAENEQRAKPDQEHSGPLNLSLSRRGAERRL
jgi:hypothetical protein